MDDPEKASRARPHQKLTPDGRRMREVLSYARRGSRLTPHQQQLWDAHAGAWWVPDEAVDDPGFSVPACFAREAPLAVEIGCGVGEATVALAAQRPQCNVLGIEVWRPGLASALGRVAQAGLTNVRLLSVDAVWSLEQLLGPASVSELWTFFPDPWPKQRHHKRRLVTARFAALAASRLEPGGWWRLATDWAAYATQMREALDAEPRLVGGVTGRWEERPLTRFERRAIAEGRPVTDLAYRRRPGSP